MAVRRAGISVWVSRASCLRRARPSGGLPLAPYDARIGDCRGPTSAPVSAAAAPLRQFLPLFPQCVRASWRPGTPPPSCIARTCGEIGEIVSERQPLSQAVQSFIEELVLCVAV